MFEGFTRQMVECEGATIRVRVGGSGPPLLLLHGNPQTHVMWHRVAPRLAETHTVVVTDLRGYGESSKPQTDADHMPYAKRSMAQDQVEVMRTLGFERFFVAGHDRGGRCAYRMALDHPDAVLRLALLDIIPTSESFWRTDSAFALAYWHWFFLAQPNGLPERLIGGDPTFFWHSLTGGLAPSETFAPEAVEAYLAVFRTPEAIHAMCEDYRAGATIDTRHDAEDRVNGRRITCPLLVLWGRRGVLERLYDVPDVWSAWAGDVRGRALECGHFLPEERPDEVFEELSGFFAEDGA